MKTITAHNPEFLSATMQVARGPLRAFKGTLRALWAGLLLPLVVALLPLTIALLAAACSSTKDEGGFAPGEFKEWAPTPPMGWNSWDCYGPTVTEAEVRANADFMARHLKAYGWEYVVVDIRWYVANDHAGGYNQTDPVYSLDEWGRYTPATNRFPSAEGGAGFAPLAEYIHSLGLKMGIHIMRGIPRAAVDGRMPILGADGITADQVASSDQLCTWLSDNYTINPDRPGAQAYYNSLMDLYASWGVDFIKIDDMSRPYHRGEIELVRHAIDRCGRPIVLSLSPGETPDSEAAHVSEHANMWRMVDDLWDQWDDVTHLMDVAERWYDHIRTGTWPDGDMLPLGHIAIRGERGEDRQSLLNAHEARSLVSLLCAIRSPLMMGGDLPTTDSLTLSLLTNPAVLEMHRVATDIRPLYHENDRLLITSRHPDSGDLYLAAFNLGNHDYLRLRLTPQELGLGEGVWVPTDLWTGEVLSPVGAGLPRRSRTFNPAIYPHACGLYRFTQAQELGQ